MNTNLIYSIKPDEYHPDRYSSSIHINKPDQVIISGQSNWIQTKPVKNQSRFELEINIRKNNPNRVFIGLWESGIDKFYYRYWLTRKKVDISSVNFILVNIIEDEKNIKLELMAKNINPDKDILNIKLPKYDAVKRNERILDILDNSGFTL